MSTQLTELAKLSTDELAIALADSTTYGGLPIDPDHKKRIGWAIFNGLLDQIREKVCPHSDNLSAAPDDNETIVRDAAFIMDLMLTMSGKFPVATLAVLTVKYGVSNICQ